MAEREERPETRGQVRTPQRWVVAVVAIIAASVVAILAEDGWIRRGLPLALVVLAAALFDPRMYDLLDEGLDRFPMFGDGDEDKDGGL